MPQAADFQSQPSRPDSPPPLRRRRVAEPTPAPSALRRRILNYVLAVVTIVLVVDALVGDKGLLETIRARRQYSDVAASLNALREENARLRTRIHRLRDDPATIESVARKELGLIRPGEMVFIIKDLDRTH